MLHVGMNIADKRALAAEIARVLKPGGKLALFDMMRGKARGDLVFPLPFAVCAEDCPGRVSSRLRYIPRRMSGSLSR